MLHTREFYEKKINRLKAQNKVVSMDLIHLRDNALTAKEIHNMRQNEHYKNDPVWREYVKAKSRINSNGVGEAIKTAAKLKCKENANYTCHVCGKTKDETTIDAHHIVPIEQGGGNDQSNLICLCRSCHQKVHSRTLVIEL